jgi:cystathionine beta-lyase/cystathionine gamma-synthase
VSGDRSEASRPGRSPGPAGGDGFGTRAVHAGLTPDPSFGSVIPAIHQTSTYAQRAPGDFVGDYDYARSANPTRAALEQALGELEGGVAVTFASGLAAAHALITVVCEAGSHVVLPADLYGGTFRLVDKVLSRWGLRFDLVDQTDLAALERAIGAETRLVWVESPTNPLLNVVDVAEVVARRRDALVAVDNTFATPANQRPLELGADFVVHSTTKYLGGHSDVVGGVVVSACASSRTQSERCRGRLTASSCTAGCARCTCGWRPTPAARRRWWRCCTRRRKRGTCAGRVSAAWSASATPVPERWPRARGCSRWRSPSAASSR